MRENVKKTERTITVDWQDGSKYSGEIENGKPHGQGKYIWPDGSSYTGDFLKGVTHGAGTEIQKSGEKYVGEFQNGKKTG